MQRLILLLTAAAILTPPAAHAVVTYVYEDTTFDSGVYDVVQIYESFDIPPIQPTVTVLDGTHISILGTGDSSIANVYGGKIGSFSTGDMSTVNLYGGEIVYGFSGYSDTCDINIYGKNFDTFFRGAWIHLSGQWADDTSFEFYFNRTQQIPEQVTLHVIPEPASIGTLALGWLMLRRRHKTRYSAKK